jgi:predicted enzyme related to lactoylglutathione lyase
MIAVTGMDLSGYMVKDAARAIAFYQDIFGLQTTAIYPDGRGAEFDLPDGSTFGLWGGGGKVMPFQPGNGILFAVDDFDGALAKLAGRAIPVIYQTETPACRMAMINDTEGNIITLHARKRAAESTSHA